MGNLALIISNRHWTDLSLARGPEGLMRLRGQRRTRYQMPMMRSRQKTAAKVTIMSVTSVQLIIIDRKKPVPEFTSDKLKVFFNLLYAKCLHVLHAYVYTLRGQEQKNLVLLRR